ncbi:MULTISPECIES: HAMP domain-containing sensor histidine kinase [unclassified Streptomyces]|uniref:sensor histidine kinase n=1 Tax=unclassified Streptomyces TaxID=2593676 RepID=UPI002E16621D|nr:HAMP domain-containing histidine kinase [Streptomyces sp. NBC_01197]WSS47969.1 HAMP domain-containing histidine kinase [Streptomyces sp. NBC_01180]
MTACPAWLWPRTLRGRLSLVAVATALLLMAILTVVFNTIAQQRLQHQADDHLRTRATAVATTVDTVGGSVRVLESPNDALLDDNVWIYAGGLLLEHPPNSSGARPLTRAADALAGHGGQGCTTLHAGRAVRLCAVAVPTTDGAAPRAVVVTALDLAPYLSSADTLLLASIALDITMLACTYALTRLAVGRALRPVHTMTDQATRWSAADSDERFRGRAGPTELTQLGGSLDALLDRIRAVLRHEQQLTKELSHELRNPLARIVAELDWLQARPRTAQETRAGQLAVADAAQSMRAICETLLDDARAGARSEPGTAVVLAVLNRLAEGPSGPSGPRTPGLTVVGGDPELSAGVSPALLERIVGPLLDNGLRHADSGVSLHVSPLPGGVRIDVTDDGPGVPGPFVPYLFHPGRRAAPDDEHTGAGLGLSLARRLARSAGGDVRYDELHATGARFVVSLPAG